MEFHLNCWVPSLSGFYQVKELKNSQLNVLSKYILNEDHLGTSQCFESILEENFLSYNTNSLTRFDKWFILCFLRATNISSMLYMNVTNSSNVPCNLEMSLFEILTRLSEINPIAEIKISLEKITFTIKPNSQLFSNDPIVDSLSYIEHNNNIIKVPSLIKQLLQTNDGIRNYLALEMIKFDNNSENLIIKNLNSTLNLKNLPVRVFDNTLFFFLRSIFLPHCKGVYEKQYNLMKRLNFSYQDIVNITPGESEIYLNLFKKDENSKSSDKL